MQFDTVKVRPISEDEIPDLTQDDLIYVDTKDYNGPVLVPAHLASGSAYYTERGKLQVKTIYGVEFWRAFEDAYVADNSGSEMDVLCVAGTRMSTSLFFPGMAEEEVQARVFAALKAEFGAGVVQVWNERYGPVADTLRDVVEVRREMVVTGSGKHKETHWVDAETRVIATGVYSAQTQHFMGREAPGWQLRIMGHVPATMHTRTI